MILAPLRGVTIRCFRETFAELLQAGGFTEAFTPFIPALAGVDPLASRELVGRVASSGEGLAVTPQLIGKDPQALRTCLQRLQAAGYPNVDLNCGCPFPMVRKKGRGSGLLRTPDGLYRLLEVGCEVLGPGHFSMKTRLGVEREDELLKLMERINGFPLRCLTVHARTARQMYTGSCHWDAFEAVRALSRVPVIPNGDLPFPPLAQEGEQMIGRSFVRALGSREDIAWWLERYVDASRAELCGERPVLGRLKELIAYWKDLPAWHRRWPVVKLCRTLAELRQAYAGR